MGPLGGEGWRWRRLVVAAIPLCSGLKLAPEASVELGGAWVKPEDVRPLTNTSPAVKEIYQLHIPRTSGSSFEIDANFVMLGNELHLTSEEGCYSWRDNPAKTYRGSPTAVMLRSPREHVLSQYLFCTGTFLAGISIFVSKTFPEWVKAWRDRQAAGIHGDFAPQRPGDTMVGLAETSIPGKCYYPINLQTQRLTCKKPSEFPREPDKDGALRTVRGVWFVGIADAYDESLCLYHVKVKGTLPPACECTAAKENEKKTEVDPFIDNSFSSVARKSLDSLKVYRGFQGIHLLQLGATAQTETERMLPPLRTTIDHGTPYHSVDEYPAETLRDIDAITSSDHEIYRVGVERFLKEVGAIEARFGKKVMCDITRAKLLKRSNSTR